MMNNKLAKRIALFGHSPYFGGAESAFVNLVKLVIAAGHTPVVFLPESKKSDLGDVFKAMNVTVDLFERHSIYGNTANALLDLSNRNLDKVAHAVQSHACEMVISNSSTFVEGALVAEKLGLPHIWSIHEMQQRNPEQPRGGLADGAFAQWFAALSDHQLFCSAATQDAHMLNISVQPKSTVLPPFLDSSADLKQRRSMTSDDDRVNLMFIGAPTVRKNPVFAIEVLAALRARGRNVHLNCLGGRRDHTGLVDSLLKRRGLKPYVHFLGKVADPYQYCSGKAINFICAKSEPFGLTVPESLSRGIPVIAPNFDGPSETLDKSCQFELNNIDQCVRLIEHVSDGYERASQDALANYKRWQHRFTVAHQTELVREAIDDAMTNYRPKVLPFELRPKHLQQALTPDILTRESVIDSIAVVTGKSSEWISGEVDKEKRADGTAVGADVKAFDVVPYQPSKQMDELYRSGLSFAIELAANYSDGARIKMAAFILVRLCTERTRLGRNLKVLAVGDGIGSDSIRLAGAGFDVDYMDYESSVTSRVATENFRKFKQTAHPDAGQLRVLNRNEIATAHYDAVISLEVIEHVEQPQEFLDFLNAQLKQEGLLFLSDCFAGITTYWQTHLLSNERLSGLIPLMAAQSGFAFEGFNQAPLCKPYVFKKSDLATRELMTAVLLDGAVMSMLVQEQVKLVKPRVRKIDKVAYIFKRLMINLRGYYVRRHLAV